MEIKRTESVALLSTEAEYIRLLEVCQEILFMKSILEFLEAKVSYPIQVHVDIQGAIFLANNEGASMRTKHVDVQYHFVREYVKDGVVKIVFV